MRIFFSLTPVFNPVVRSKYKTPMNTFGYLKLVIRDEFRALKEEARESKIFVITLIVAIIGLVIYLKPFPDRHIFFAAFHPNSDWSQLVNGSANHVINKTGLDIKAIYTEGAVENVARLNDPNDQANAGFTYGLVLEKEELNGIYSLGSIGYEPVWILYNQKRTGKIHSLNTLAQYKVGLGPVKSGSYRIAKKIFEVINIEVDGRKNFLSDTFANNGAKLKNGEIDAFIFVSTNRDSATQDLLHSPNIAIFDFKNADAYSKKFNSFVKLTLPADSLDIDKQLPKHDISMLATTTSLVVKRTMHPDLQLALLMGAKDGNRNSNNLFFAKRNEFPAYVDPLIPISPVAEHYYDYGPPHSMRYLPYWLAGLVDRTWLILLTILAIFYPLSKLNFHFRKFRFTVKEIPHYKELLEIEKRLCNQKVSAQDKVEMMERLDRINSIAIQGEVPISEEAAYFRFLNAIHLLRKKIEDA